MRTLSSATVWRILPLRRQVATRRPNWFLSFSALCGIFLFFFFRGFCDALLSERPFVSGSPSASLLNDSESSLGRKGKRVQPGVFTSLRVRPLAPPVRQGVTFLLFLFKRPERRAGRRLPVHYSNPGKHLHSSNRRNLFRLSSEVHFHNGQMIHLLTLLN